MHDGVAPTPPEHESPHDLCRRLRSGDENARGPLLVALDREVLSVMTEIKVPVDLCDTVRSHANQQIALSISKLKGESDAAVHGWVKRIVERCISPAEDEEAAPPHVAYPPDLTASPCSSSSTAAEVEEVTRGALEMVDWLGHPDSVIVKMNMNGRSPSEIGAALDLAPRKVRYRLSRALARLRTYYKHNDKHGADEAGGNHD